MENLEINHQKMYNFKAGEVLLVNKPTGWTSFDVVNKLRFKIKHKLGVKKIKVGHAGTLDPLATGLLIICTGKKTKQINEYQGLDKTYTGTMKIGATTASYDAETPEDATFPTTHITPKLIEETSSKFLGELEQLPPMFSAIKVNGQPLYKKARKGEKVEVKPRKVTINSFTVDNAEMPCLNFEVECSKGTYIRSLAYDFGKALDSGAYLTRLERTAIGEHSLKDAWELDDLLEDIEKHTLPLEES